MTGVTGVRAARKLLLVGIGCVLGLVGLELALQVVSFVVWMRGSGPTAHGVAGGQTVLCIGDSFTHGMGGSDSAHAYPARLATALQAAGGAWQVFNCGWPGSTSKDVLGKLPGQLAAYRPDLVYVLVGYNDSWGEPDIADVAEAGSPPPAAEGFRWEIRTLRFLRMIRHALSGSGSRSGDAEPAHQAPPAFVGEWHAGERWMRFGDDRSLATDTGDYYWSLRDGKLVLHFADKKDELVADWRVENGRLRIASESLPAVLEFEAGPPMRHDLDRARAALRRGDLPAAEALFRSCLARPELADPGRAGLIRVLVRLERVEEARRETDALRERFRSRADSELGRLLAESSIEVGDVEGAMALVGEMLASMPVDAGMVNLVIRHGLELRDRTALRSAVGTALRRDDLLDPVRAGLLGVKARLCEGDLVVALQCVIEAQLLDPDSELIRRTVRREPGRFTSELIEQALARMTLGDGEREAVRAKFQAALSSDDSTGEVLAAHLRQIVQLCRRAGAESVLLTYPEEVPEVAATVREIARELSVGLVDLAAPFVELLATASHGDYFVLDGHCNDRGYQVIADTVAADALRRVR